MTPWHALGKYCNTNSGLYASLLNGQGHQDTFFFVGHPVRKLQISTGAFQGHQGNDKGAWRQSPPLPPSTTLL